MQAINTSGTTSADSGTWWSFIATVAPAVHSIYLPLAIKPLPLPSAFTKSAPSNGATGQLANPTLSWTASTGATGYQYCLDIVNNNTCDTSWVSTGASTSVPLSGLSLATSYYWQVQAVNTSGTTSADGGTWWSFTTLTPATDWTTILSEDFEGSFTGVWQVLDNNGSGYKWAKSNCRAFAGSYSGWGVGGGSGGASLPCGSHYPDNVETWMIYGPFSLADATAANLTFQLWLNGQQGVDSVDAFASTDGSAFYGLRWLNTSGWASASLDLSNVYTLGNLLGKPEVWVAFVFESDASTNYPEGGYVDNIVLRKCTLSSCAYGDVAGNSYNGQLIGIPAEASIEK